MSVSQVKKQFEDMLVYLGKDAAGVEKLRKLKEAFNGLRTRLAESLEARTTAEARANALFTECNKANSELLETKNEVHRLNQLLGNIERELSQATIAEHDEESSSPVSQTGLTNKQKQYRSVIKELIKVTKFCPEPHSKRQNAASKTALFYDINDISNGWSHKSLWTLGASVAVLAAIHGSVGLISSDHTEDLEPVDEEDKDKDHLTTRWVAKSIALPRFINDPINAVRRDATNRSKISDTVSRLGGGSWYSGSGEWNG